MKIRSLLSNSVLWYVACVAGGAYMWLGGNWTYVLVVFLLYLAGYVFAASEYTKGATMATKKYNDAMEQSLTESREWFDNYRAERLANEHTATGV